MDIDESFVDAASVSQSDAKLLTVESWDVLQLRASLRPGHPEDPVATCIVQTVVKPNDIVGTGPVKLDKNEERLPEIQICPLIYDIMCTSTTALSPEVNDSQDSAGDDGQESTEDPYAPVTVAPIPVPSALTMICDNTIQQFKSVCWTARRIVSKKDLPAGSAISLRLLYMEDELLQFCEESNKDYIETLKSTISFFIAGRVLMEGTTTVIHTEEGMAMVAVKQIQENLSGQESETSSTTDTTAYHLCGHGDYKLEIEHKDIVDSQCDLRKQHDTAAGVEWRPECPGYDNLVHTMIQLASLKGPAAPSGILLTGSPLVGKTHLASSVAYHLSRASAAVHWVSVQDLLLQATWANESDLVAILRPPTPLSPDQIQFLVLDDLHIFATEESALHEDSVTLNLDPELLVVKNAVLQIIDELALSRASGSRGASILGIAQSSSSLPSGFVKSGRFEKEIGMLPPTESQREMILRRLIPTLTVEDEKMTNKWAEALTPVTVGCVAGDLRRILSDAWTKAMARGGENNLGNLRVGMLWDDLRKAAQTYVPIQLETVDVCKPKSFLSPHSEGRNDQNLSIDPEDWATIHKISWEPFGGYPLVKKRLLRTVVGPWRRFLKSVDLDDDTTSPTASMGLSPPPGVLFHGDSGNGKSFAAGCLASSLGLPMIKVKAADVMDKWLGGSEAIIRSLFARARSAAPCILFFDELDSLATNRASGDEGGAEVMSRLLSTLLNEMDGISSDRRRQSVLVVACTNRLEDLDAALLRPGRLEEHILLKHPDATDIRDILRIHLSKVPLSQQVDLDTLAQDLAARGVSGAEVEGLCHEACLCAVHRATASVVLLTPDDIQSAIMNSSS